MHWKHFVKKLYSVVINAIWRMKAKSAADGTLKMRLKCFPFFFSLNFVFKIKRPYFHVKPLEREQLRNWYAYLDYEQRTRKKSRILFLFERCMIACANYEEMWIKVAFLTRLCKYRTKGKHWVFLLEFGEILDQLIWKGWVEYGLMNFIIILLYTKLLFFLYGI